MSNVRMGVGHLSEVLIQERDGAVRFSVRVQPRAARTEVAGVHAGALKVRLHAAPVDGAANEALVEFLAEILGVAARHVRIIRGTAARLKTVEVVGVSRQHLHRLTSSP